MALTPGHRHQQHQAYPVDAFTCHNVPALRTYRVMEATLVGDASSPSALQSAINEQDQGGIRIQERHDQQSEQNATQVKRRPDRSIQHTMIGGKMALITLSYDSQGGCYRPST